MLIHLDIEIHTYVDVVAVVVFNYVYFKQNRKKILCFSAFMKIKLKTFTKKKKHAGNKNKTQYNNKGIRHNNVYVFVVVVVVVVIIAVFFLIING